MKLGELLEMVQDMDRQNPGERALRFQTCLDSGAHRLQELRRVSGRQQTYCLYCLTWFVDGTAQNPPRR